MIFRLFSSLLVLLLAGCTSLPEYTPQQSDWQQREVQLMQFQQWQLEGRIAIRTEDDSWSGSLTWQQLGQLYDIHFSGPFGQGAISLTGDQYRVVLSSAEGDIIGNAGAEQLLYQQLGWQVPLSHLQYWVVGRPSPEVTDSVLQFDEFGRIKHLQQSDWQVSYRRYQPYLHLELPAKIFIENHRLSVRLVIDNWQQPELISKNL